MKENKCKNNVKLGETECGKKIMKEIVKKGCVGMKIAAPSNGRIADLLRGEI